MSKVWGPPQSIPVELGLQIVEGFVTNKNGALSNQIDCMLVMGSGEKIPYTEIYKYNITNVIAVLEVKKNLYSNELEDTYNNLRSVYEVIQPNEINYKLFRDSYVSILGEFPPLHKDVNTLPIWQQEIYRTLVLEVLLPVRIGIGYHGFTREKKFREAFIEYLADNVGKQKYGPVSLPNLLISEKFSIIKLNGMPYSVPLKQRTDNYWHFLATYSGNPLILLLELIWTKITYHFGIFVPGYTDDLQIERLKPLLLTQAVETNNNVGWIYQYIPFNEKDLAAVPLFTTWQPAFLSTEQAVVLHELLQSEEIDTNSPDFIKFIEPHGEVINFINSLVSTGLVSYKENKIKLLTQECAIVVMPGGTIVAGENSNGRLSNWIDRYISDRDKKT